MMGKWIAGWLLPMTLSIAGCAGMHLHDVGNAKLAKDASEAVTALGIDEAFARQTQVQKNLLDKQIELARSFALADRDATLARLALSEKTLREDWYLRDFVRRFTELGAGSLKHLRDAQIDLDAAEQNLATAKFALDELLIDTTCTESPPREVMTLQQLREAARKALAAQSKPQSAQDIDDLATLLETLDQKFVEPAKNTWRCKSI